jgi:hypothetical protein
MSDGYKVYASQEWINENNPIKTIDKSCHIADLDEGIYIIKGSLSDGNGKVTFENLTLEGEIKDNYSYITDGTLIILKKTVHDETDYTEAIINFTATGVIQTPNRSVKDEITDENGDIVIVEHTTALENANTVNCVLLQALKFKTINEDEYIDDIKIDTWYSVCPYMFSDIPVDAITKTITKNSTHFEFPSAKAVYDYIDSIKIELQGDLDEIGDLVGGETGEDSGTEEAVTLIETAEYEFRPEDMPEGCMNCIIDLDNDIAKNVFVEGGEYTLTIDGIPYQITLSTHADFQYDDGSVSFIFGNLGIYSSDYTNTEEDYVGAVVYDSHGESYLSFILKTTETTHTVSLSYEVVAE